MEDDRTKIFAAIRQLLPRGFLDLENLVKERLREWTMEAAEEALAAMDPLQRGTSSRLINQVAMYFQELGRYDRAEPLYEEDLATSRRVLGDLAPQSAPPSTASFQKWSECPRTWRYETFSP